MNTNEENQREERTKVNLPGLSVRDSGLYEGPLGSLLTTKSYFSCYLRMYFYGCVSRSHPWLYIFFYSISEYLF